MQHIFGDVKPRSHLAEYVSDCLRKGQLSNREQSETDRHGNLLLLKRNRYCPYNILNYLLFSWIPVSFCLITAQLSCLVCKMFVKCSETVKMNLHIIGSTFVNIRINGHTLHFIIPIGFR